MSGRGLGVARALAAGALALLPAVGLAHDYALGALWIYHPHARASPSKAKSAGVYMSIENTGTASDRLTGASAPVAAEVAPHQTVLEGGTLKMRTVAAVEVAPGATLKLRRDGYHLMLLELKQPLAAGDKFPLTLTFERGGTVVVSVQVEELGMMPWER